MKDETLTLVYPVRFSKNEFEKIREIAESEDRSAASVIRLALRGYLKKSACRKVRGGIGQTEHE